MLDWIEKLPSDESWANKVKVDLQDKEKKLNSCEKKGTCLCLIILSPKIYYPCLLSVGPTSNKISSTKTTS